ncbi:MAG TPA: hypothetical protein VGG83_04625 [Trebonia sp.]
MANDPGVDVIGNHEDKRRLGLFQGPLHGRRVEQPDRDIDGLAVAALRVQVNLAGVHDRPQPQPQRWLRGLRVVLGEHGCQQRYQSLKQDRLGYGVMRPDKDQNPVAAVGQLL